MTYSINSPVFTIAVASQLSHLHARTLMLYEKAGLIKPFRTKTHQRRFSQQDLAAIKFIHYLTQQKQINLAGIKVIFAILKELKPHHPRLKTQLFPDFKP